MVDLTDQIMDLTARFRAKNSKIKASFNSLINDLFRVLLFININTGIFFALLYLINRGHHQNRQP
jgi:hypothetical protein